MRIETTKLLCDRCNKEIAQRKFQDFLKSKLTMKAEYVYEGLDGCDGGTSTDEYDLCDDCTNELIKFLKTGKSGATK